MYNVVGLVQYERTKVLSLALPEVPSYCTYDILEGKVCSIVHTVATYHSPTVAIHNSCLLWHGNTRTRTVKQLLQYVRK